MLCDYRQEYPCLRRVQNLEDLWNFTLYKPCIPLSQIGDGIVQCYGSRDEKNTIQIKGTYQMLGSRFLCENTNLSIPYIHMCNKLYKCSSSEDDYGCLIHKIPTAALTNNTLCGYDLSDVVCLNGNCKKRARCDNNPDCEYGEDEYMCYLDFDMEIPISEKMNYRSFRQFNAKHTRRTPQISNFPVALNSITDKENIFIKLTTQEKVFLHKSKVELFNKFQIAYNCNRGVTIHVLNDNTLTCFCPPSYYGEHCEYYSDRLSIVTHLNYTNSPYLNMNNDSLVLQILVLFLFEDEVIDHYSFHVRPTDEIDTYVKHKFFLLYSRSEKYLNHKQRRYFNRTDIINKQPYSVRFELYELTIDQSIRLVGLWKFPIYFDYLPSFRLAKVLRFPVSYTANDPCQSNPCNRQSICQRIFNENSTSAYVCLCRSPFYGKECEFTDENCSKFCAPHSICKAKYNGILTSNQQPLCLCPLNYYGPRCYLKYTVCESQPCANNASCTELFDPTEVRRYHCKCTTKFYGRNCEYERIPLRIQMKSSSLTTLCPTSVLALVVQYFDLEPLKIDLYLQYQQLSSDFQLRWQYNHDQSVLPAFAILKLYDNNYYQTGPLFYLLFIQQNKTKINVTVELNETNHCVHVSTLINKSGKLIH
jgi:hypothetical protein